MSSSHMFPAGVAMTVGLGVALVALILLAVTFRSTLSLVFKQMRERALGTWLTLLSVTLGVALAVAIMLLRQGSEALFGQTDYGADVLIGPKGSPLQLTLNTIYHIDVSPGTIPYDVYADMLKPARFRQYVRIAIPYAVGDTYEGKYRIVGTLPKLFGVDDETGVPLPPDKVMEYRPGKVYEMAEGRVFNANKFEAILGSDLVQRTKLRIGSTFQATHGMPKPGETPDIHPEVWTVVGVLKPTHTANDRVVFIPLTSFYTIAEHGAGLQSKWYIRNHLPIPEIKEDEQHYTKDADGTIHLTIPDKMWAVSAILVKSRGGITSQSLIYNINNGGEEDTMAVNPASVMREFFDTFLSGSATLLLMISLLVTIVAAVGILVSIYNSVSARRREIAILRALGATRARILTLICLEAGLIGLLGGLAGIIVGHLLGGAGSFYMNRILGQGFNWLTFGSDQMLYWLVVVLIAVLAGLVPALKAYRVSVATNLVAG